MSENPQHNLPVPFPQNVDPHNLSDEHQTGIYQVRMNIIFPGGDVMRFSDNPAVTLAHSLREAANLFQQLAQRDMEEAGTDIAGTVHPDLDTLALVTPPGRAQYV